MITEKEIFENLLPLNSDGLPDSFVAASVKINEKGVAYHAGIVIKHGGISYLFHYTGEDVLIEESPNGDYYFHKDFIFIKGPITASFLAHCHLIKENAVPEYNYFYSGSYYDTNGRYFSNIDMPECMTCVGFCINVIKGYIEEDEYFQFSDWTKESAESVEFLNRHIQRLLVKHPTADVNLLIDNMRRICPDEYLASAFLYKLPITKTKVDQIIENIRMVLISKLN